MRHTAAITVNRSRQEVERLWNSEDVGSAHIRDSDASVRFADAPGDRGTEIVVELQPPSAAAGKVVEAVKGSGALAKVKDELRRFKQLVETGEIARSDATPEGELAERKLKQRPAQPLPEAELQQVGA